MSEQQIFSQFELEKKETFYQCSCSSEAIMLTKWVDEDEVYMSLWQQGFRMPMTIIQRLKFCWRVLTKGVPHSDQLVLTREVARAMGEQLVKLTDKQFQ